MKAKWLTILLALTLSGCVGGGGGGSSPSTSQATTFPIAGAMSAFAQASHKYTLTARDGSNTDTLQVNITRGASSTFEGQVASTMNEALTISRNNVVLMTAPETIYFIDSPYTPLGSIALSTGQYSVASNQRSLPAYATVGQSGQDYTETTYANSSKASIISNATVTWALDPDTATTAWLCANETIIYTNGSPTLSGVECYAVETTGNISAMKLTVYVNGQAFTFQ